MSIRTSERNGMTQVKSARDRANHDTGERPAKTDSRLHPWTGSMATIHRNDENGVVAEIMSSSCEGSNSTPFGESDRKRRGNQNHAACIKDGECYRTVDRVPLICAFLIFYVAGKRCGGKNIVGGTGLCGSEKRLIEIEIIRNECQARQAVKRARPMLLSGGSREAISQIVSTGAPRDDV
jgi:hypothetical protein